MGLVGGADGSGATPPDLTGGGFRLARPGGGPAERRTAGGWTIAGVLPSRVVLIVIAPGADAGGVIRSCTRVDRGGAEDLEAAAGARIRPGGCPAASALCWCAGLGAVWARVLPWGAVAEPASEAWGLVVGAHASMTAGSIATTGASGSAHARLIEAVWHGVALLLQSAGSGRGASGARSVAWRGP